MTLIYWISGIIIVWLLLRKFIRSIEKINDEPEPKEKVTYNRWGIPEDNN